MGHHALFQGIFPTQGSNPGLPNCRRILYCLSHQGSPLVVSINTHQALGKDQGHRAGGGGEGGEGFRSREQLGAEIYISLQVIPAEWRPDKDYSSVEEESRAQREKSERP